MKNGNRKNIALYVPVFALCVTAAISNNVAATNYTIQIQNQLTGDDITSHQFEFELRDAITDELVQTKRGNSETVIFDPITTDVPNGEIRFYKVIEKNLAEPGMTYDEQVSYVGLHSDGKVAYQKDNTYKYVDTGDGPQPYHASEEELQGEAYAVFDADAETLTFFRDEPGKYTTYQIDGHKVYFANVEHSSSGPSYSWYWADIGRHSTHDTLKEIIMEDPIRPIGPTDGWFSNMHALEKADISKLDSSKMTSFRNFFAVTESLVDLDITTLDFSSLEEAPAEPLARFLRDSNGIKEFDSRNFDFSRIIGSRPLLEAFTGSGLRYLNVENLTTGGSSAEFSNLACLEKVVIGDVYSFYNGGGFGDPDQWLSLKDNRIVSRSEMNDYHLDGRTKGEYIRPSCYTGPVLFVNNYTKQARPDAPVSPNNPNTASTSPVVYFALLGVLSSALILGVPKRIH